MTSYEQTVAIAVIGVTRSGKSTFINLASGSGSPVSNSPGSCTTDLKSSTFSLDGRNVILIDTPGFDDTTPSVLHVLKLISDHFSGRYSQGVKLAGVIYMHCITEDHMRGLSRDNFHVFNKFCGGTSLKDILVVTNEQPGYADKDGFFAAVDSGAQILYHDGSQASAHAILRHFLGLECTGHSAKRNSLDQKTDCGRATTGANVVRQLTSQAEHHTKTFGQLCQRMDAATLVEDDKTRKTLEDEARNSLEKIERIRHDLEQMVANITTKNSRLEDENRRYKNDFAAQKAEAELGLQLLGREREARERAEAQLAEERALSERQKTDKETSKEHTGPKYDKLFACGALIFVLFCVSRFALDGPPSLP